MKTNFSRLLAIVAFCVPILFLCACDEWFDFGAKPTSRPTTQPTNQPATLQVHFIDVGQGDAILIDFGTMEILIDGGGRLPGVIDYIETYVDDSIEVMVATHPHADHIGGLIEVLNRFDVDEIWLNGDTATSKTYNDFMAAVNSEGAQIREARRGDSIVAGALTFRVLHPIDPPYTNTNDNSIVLSLSYKGVYFLFTGDAEVEAESSMIEAGLLSEVDILKIGHHGSRTASSPAFLNIIRPEVAIYMAGTGNTYGHPHAESIAALQGIGAAIYGTDTSGTIVITCDGSGYSIQREK